MCMTSQKQIGHTMAMNYGLSPTSFQNRRCYCVGMCFWWDGGEGGCKVLHACNTWGIAGFGEITGNCEKKNVTYSI